MSRLPIILCVVALLGAAALAALDVRLGNAKRALQTELATSHTRAAALESRLAAANTEREAREKQLLALDADLGAAKTRLTVSEARNSQLTRDLTQARSALAARDEAALALKTQIESLQHDLANAGATTISPEAIEAYKTTVADLQQQLADARQAATAASRDLAQAQASATANDETTAALKSRIEALQHELADARTPAISTAATQGYQTTIVDLQQQLADTRQAAAAAARDLTQAQAAVAAGDEATAAQKARIEALQQDLADARASTVPADTIQGYKTTIADLERQLADARNGAAVTQVAGASTAVFSARVSPTPVAAEPAPAGRAVLTVGPANAFVVLGYGAVHGAAVGQALAIQRSGATVAIVSISDVRPNFCIAQVRPDSLHGALQKGDSAVLTN
ncbi:MAG TPA: hypothetical protein VHE13_13970 [Opitutus sp.]|nr:hypothetical protein [Opitutus sp.]